MIEPHENKHNKRLGSKMSEIKRQVAKVNLEYINQSFQDAFSAMQFFN